MKKRRERKQRGEKERLIERVLRLKERFVLLSLQRASLSTSAGNCTNEGEGN